jgi:hypothetical protein
MARRRRSTVALSADQAQKALAVLVQEGKLTAREVLKALQRRDRLIRALRNSLAALGENAGRVGKRLFRAGALSIRARRGGAAKPKVARRKPRISAATRKKFQTQGRYMAALRNLSKGSRAKIKAIRKKSGVEAAIAAAKEMAK